MSAQATTDAESCRDGLLLVAKFSNPAPSIETLMKGCLAGIAFNRVMAAPTLPTMADLQRYGVREPVPALTPQFGLPHTAFPPIQATANAAK